MYKMIVTDLDGTLLDDYKEISKENIDMINRAYHEKCVISVIATGKPIQQTENIALRVDKHFAKYIISSNGAIIKDTERNEYIDKRCLSNEDALKLIDICKKEGLDCFITTTDKTLLDNEFILEYQEKGIDANLQKDMNEYIINNNINMASFLIIGLEEEKEDIEEKLRKMYK